MRKFLRKTKITTFTITVDEMLEQYTLTSSLCRALVVMVSACFLSACSVGMALDGQKDPDLSVVKTHANRTDIELQLGSPIHVNTTPDGNIRAVYEYEVGNEPNTGRAVAHGVMGVLTLGLWEVVGTPVEALKGDKLRLTVTCDSKGDLVSATPSKV